ncbi:MAG: hypothetical protein R3F60_04450 [bacterium]
MLRVGCLIAGLLAGCGGAPETAPTAAPVGPAAAVDVPNPCVANPCDATLIDPSVNPCVGPAAEGAAPAVDADGG